MDVYVHIKIGSIKGCCEAYSNVFVSALIGEENVRLRRMRYVGLF